MAKLSAGAQVEMEHASDWGRIKKTKSPEEMAEIIASAHTKEFPNYYPALKKMEDELNEEKHETKRNKSNRRDYKEVADERREKLGK